MYNQFICTTLPSKVVHINWRFNKTPKPFLNKLKLKEFITTKPGLQEMFKIPHTDKGHWLTMNKPENIQHHGIGKQITGFRIHSYCNMLMW